MALIRGILIVVAIIILNIGILFLYRYLIQKRTLRDILKNISPNGISCIEKINLGGIDQSISIESGNRNNPLLLFLHGGPGMLIPSGVGFRNKHQGITKLFILVSWDQRRAGNSYNPHIPEQSLNVSQFVADTDALIEYLKNLFHASKIILAAQSWGSIIAMNYIANYPDDIYA
jgi:pimeloyl-ACP methyl ester carboxylesterase